MICIRISRMPSKLEVRVFFTFLCPSRYELLFHHFRSPQNLTADFFDKETAFVLDGKVWPQKTDVIQPAFYLPFSSRLEPPKNPCRASKRPTQILLYFYFIYIPKAVYENLLCNVLISNAKASTFLDRPHQ